MYYVRFSFASNKCTGNENESFCLFAIGGACPGDYGNGYKTLRYLRELILLHIVTNALLRKI